MGLGGAGKAKDLAASLEEASGSGDAGFHV